MKIICTGRIVKGGAVEITAPVQPERNAEAQAMDADLAAMLRNGCPVHFTNSDYEAMEREELGR